MLRIPLLEVLCLLMLAIPIWAETIRTEFKESPQPCVRFQSGRVVAVEGLREGRWVSRYWTADGRFDWSNELRQDEALLITILKTPSDSTPTVVSSGWRFVRFSESDRGAGGARVCTVELNQPTHALNLKIHTVLDGTPILTRTLEITNTSDHPVALTELSVWSGRQYAHTYYKNFIRGEDPLPFQLGSFVKNEWGSEGWFDWKPLDQGTTILKCEEGQGFNDPFFILRNRAKGENLIGHLAWSANWALEFEYKKAKDPGIDWVRFALGPRAKEPLRVIGPGESIKTPAVHLGLVAGDLDQTVQAMHEHLRRSVLPKRAEGRDGLIQYLVPADQGYLREHPEGMTEKTVRDNIDLAAAIGTELFILDAGWWTHTLDWIPDPARFPAGIKPLRDYAHEKGMLFGVYAELEGGRGAVHASHTAKEHPEWIGPKAILNLTIPKAAAWMESELHRLIEENELDLFRLDYNPLFTGEGPSSLREGFRENNAWRYYEAVYSVYGRARTTYPNLILQQCAAGGARNDLGIMSQFHEAYLTDGLWIPNVLRSFYGQSLGIPPEVFVTAHGAFGQPGRGRAGNLDTHLRMTYALGTPQHFSGMVAPDLESMPEERRALFGRYAEVYKRFMKPLLPTCRMFHHAPADLSGGVDSSGWFAAEFAAPDGRKGWTLIANIGESENDTYLFHPRGLLPNKTYRITFDSLDSSAVIPGYELMRDGIPVRLENLGSSELLLFEEAG